MKAPDFDYQRPQSLAGALRLMANTNEDIAVLAGGQSLMPMMHLRLAQPDMLVDLNAISELNYIEEDDTSITIGAMTRYATLEKSSLIKEHLPLLSMALPHIAHSAIRNRGTIGGSSALADPAAEMPALLLALNAQMNLVSTDNNGNVSERTIAADDFFTGLYETALENNELIRSITVNKATREDCFGFHEVTRRHGDYAIAGVAINACGSKPIQSIRIAFFGVSDVATRVKNTEELLTGEILDDAALYERAIKSLSSIEFLDDLNASVAGKQHYAGVVLKRALQDMAKASNPT